MHTSDAFFGAFVGFFIYLFLELKNELGDAGIGPFEGFSRARNA